jgi:hypothetical protein
MYIQFYCGDGRSKEIVVFVIVRFCYNVERVFAQVDLVGAIEQLE